jgi:hypothetical protein
LLQQVGDLFELNVKLLCQRLKKDYGYTSIPLWPFMAYSRANFTVYFNVFVGVAAAWVGREIMSLRQFYRQLFMAAEHPWTLYMYL